MITNPFLKVGATGLIYETEFWQPFKAEKQVIAIVGRNFIVKKIGKGNFLVDTSLSVGEICFDVPKRSKTENVIWRNTSTGFEKIYAITNKDGSVSELVTVFVFEKRVIQEAILFKTGVSRPERSNRK